jgi:hypothetical protein
VRLDADVTLYQEETEETVGNGLKDEANKNNLLPRIRGFV